MFDVVVASLYCNYWWNCNMVCYIGKSWKCCMSPKDLRISTSNHHMCINWFMVSTLPFLSLQPQHITHRHIFSPYFLCHGPYVLWMCLECIIAANPFSHLEAAQSETWVWHVWCAIVLKAHHSPSEVTLFQVQTMTEDVQRLPIVWSRRYHLAIPLQMVASQPLKLPLSLVIRVMA